MEMHQVRYFLAVARHLNFTRAADQMRVAQPSLTRAIQKLEAELEGPLFRRERSNTHLTELGRMMLPHLQAAHAAAETARDQARSLKRQEAGSLSLGVVIGIDAEMPSRLVGGLVKDLPSLEFSVEVTSRAAVEQRLIAGEFDAAILATVGAISDRFDLHPVQEERLVVVFGEHHGFAGRSSVPLASLDGEPLVVRIDCGVEDEITAVMAARGLARQVRHRSNHMCWTADLVRSGLACAIVPKAAALVHKLPYAVLEDLPVVHGAALATVPGRRHSTALTALIRLVRSEAGPASPE